MVFKSRVSCIPHHEYLSNSHCAYASVTLLVVGAGGSRSKNRIQYLIMRRQTSGIFPFQIFGYPTTGTLQTRTLSEVLYYYIHTVSAHLLGSPMSKHQQSTGNLTAYLGLESFAFKIMGKSAIRQRSDFTATLWHYLILCYARKTNAASHLSQEQTAGHRGTTTAAFPESCVGQIYFTVYRTN